ncbi:MAG TPA: cyclase, partial [Mycobacterium sp.]|nr:cyclase [Mycobacterium sp.]
WPVEVLDLEPLSDDEADALIAALKPGLSSDERSAVIGRCDGVPFYIEQVVQGVSESGVPDALYDPLFARLRGGAHVGPVVEAAAVIGRHVERPLLCSVVELDDEQVDRVIDELEDALVFEPWGPDVWRFRHELLREVASELAPPSVRRGLHGRVADALSGGAEPEWRVVAAHYERAERFDESADAFERASADALRRGALTEARACLTAAIEQVARATAGPDRDRREMRLRLQRGCMPTSPEVFQSGSQEADFERCLQLGVDSLHTDELSAALSALVLHFMTHANLVRAVHVLESLGPPLVQHRDLLSRVIDGTQGSVAWLRGDFVNAQNRLERATAGVTEIDESELATVWYHPNEPRALGYHHLALARLMRGDVAGAEEELSRAKSWIDQLGFPLGPYSHGYAGFIDSWICIESGRLDQAVELTEGMVELAQRHGFDAWLIVGSTQQAAAKALAALEAGDAELSAHITVMTMLVNTWRTVGLKIYLTMYDCVLGRLLLAAGDVEQARLRFDTALKLAEQTGMRFYDAELLRLRARTQADVGARRADISAARALAAEQGAGLFELRAALDDFELRGAAARAGLIDVVGRVPSSSALPELARARDFLG